MANTKITTAVIKDDAITSAKIADDVALGGNPTTTTQSAGNNTTRIATTAFVTTAVSNLVDSAPSALDTLNELAAALGDDANFSTTITNSVAAKLPLAGGTMTGALIVDAGNSGLDIRLGTDKRVTWSGGIGEIGNTAGFQALNTVGSALAGFGIRASELKFATGSSTRLTIDSSGNATFSGSVTADAGRFDNQASTPVRLHINNSGTNDYASIYADTASAYKNLLINPNGGNLLVAKTTVDSGTVGFEARATGEVMATAAGTAPFYAKRNTNAGDVIVVQGPSGTAGSIGVASDTTYFTGKYAGIFANYYNASHSTFNPVTPTGVNRDGLDDLGYTSSRFRHLYLSGAVYLGGTGSANELDDYETGTFQMNMAGVSGGAVGNGKYVKIGSLVHWQFYSGAVTVSGSGSATLTGLPFPPTSSTGCYQAFVTAHNTYSGTATTGYLQLGGNNAYITTTNTTASAPFVARSPAYIMAAGTYYTDA